MDVVEIGRVIDANLNRLREGIRVIEDTLRYIHNDTSLALSCKNLRHHIKSSLSLFVGTPPFKSLLSARNVSGDVAQKSIPEELKRENLHSLMLANFKRAQESARVLEEYTKLESLYPECSTRAGQSDIFKKVRYELYELEKKYFELYA